MSSIVQPLFDPDQPDQTHLAARATDPDTSHAAAAAVNGARDRERVLRALAEHGPMTDFELGDRIDRQQTSAGKRRHELQAVRLVEYAGIKRPTPSGSTARVWRLTRAGLYLAESGRSWRLVKVAGVWSLVT